MKKVICSFLCVILLCGFTPAIAAENETEMEEIKVSRNAAQHGVMRYDAITKEETFIPAEDYDNGYVAPIPASENLLTEAPPDIMTRGVIGGDDRLRISKPADRYESTCLIGSRFGNEVSTGTGWLIDENYVMTAGHMLYQNGYGYADHVAVYVGASGGSWKQYRLGHYYHVGDQYVDNCRNEFDYTWAGMFDDWGIIKLDSPVTVNVDMLGKYAVNGAADMQGLYYTQGYPEDKNAGISNWSQWYMYATSGRITGDRRRYLDVVNTSMDIVEGQSGGPVYSYRSGYGYCAEGTVVSHNASENAIILLNNWLMGYISTLP